MEKINSHLLFDETLPVNEKLNKLDEIGASQDRSVIDRLIQQIEMEDQLIVRERIILLLEDLLDSRNSDEIERMFHSFDAYVRNAAIEIMRINVRKYEAIAEKFFRHYDKDIRKFALDVFGDAESEYLVKLVQDSLEDEDINISITAIEMLGKQKPSFYTIELIEQKLLSEKNILLQCTALKALGEFRIAMQYEKILEHYQKDISPLVLVPLTDYLIKVGDEKAIDLILYHLKEDHYKDWMVALHAVKSLIRKLTSPSAKKKYHAELRKLPSILKDEAMKWYVLQIMSNYDDLDIESYKEFLMIEECKGNIDDVLFFIEKIGETGDGDNIILLENLAEYSEEDCVLEAIGEAIVKIKERNGLPKN